MGMFIENINSYMSNRRIKQAYLCLKSGIEPSKLSRLLNETQDITSRDMEKISNALGQRVDYFVSDDFERSLMDRKFETEVAFYAGMPGKAQEEFALTLVELIENADEILSAEDRILMMCQADK